MPRPIDVTTESTSGTATLPMKPPTWNLAFEYLSVSTRKMPRPVPVAPHDANACVDGPPNVSQFDPGYAYSVLSIVQSGRGLLSAFLIGPSVRSAIVVSVIAGASSERCHRPFQPTVASGSL